MAGIQLNFNLRTSSKCKTVHLVGSWDNYKSNLPLNKDSSKSGGWKGTFRFVPPTLLPGQRYWYYYIIDGYHVSHDPNHNHVTEPTTGRQLNVLDIPPGGGTGHTTQNMAPSSGHRSRHSTAANGRGLSPSQIQHPYPSRPYETQVFRSEKFSSREMEALSRRYAAQRLADSGSSSGETSDSDNSLPSVPSLSSRSSQNSSPSSISSLGSGSPMLGSTAQFMGGMQRSACSCERYAVTKTGQRVKLDCGGRVCGSDESGESSETTDSGDEKRRGKKKSSGSSSKKSSGKRRGLRLRR